MQRVFDCNVKEKQKLPKFTNLSQIHSLTFRNHKYHLFYVLWNLFCKKKKNQQLKSDEKILIAVKHSYYYESKF